MYIYRHIYVYIHYTLLLFFSRLDDPMYITYTNIYVVFPNNACARLNLHQILEGAPVAVHKNFLWSLRLHHTLSHRKSF